MVSPVSCFSHADVGGGFSRSPKQPIATTDEPPVESTNSPSASQFSLSFSQVYCWYDGRGQEWFVGRK